MNKKMELLREIINNFRTPRWAEHEKFFAGVLKLNDNEIYSFSYGTGCMEAFIKNQLKGMRLWIL
ncbi:hypothetical protein [Clostridium sp.]